MKTSDSVAFVTGANRGLGLAFVKELLTGRGKSMRQHETRKPFRSMVFIACDLEGAGCCPVGGIPEAIAL